MAAGFGNLGGDFAHHVFEQRRRPILIHEQERAPHRHLKLRETNFGTVPILYTLELGLPEQPAIEPVRPGVIRAADSGDLTAALRQHGAAVAADVGKGAQLTVLGARHHYGLACDIACQVTAPLRDGGRMSYGLPGASEYLPALDFEHRRLGIPSRRNG